MTRKTLRLFIIIILTTGISLSMFGETTVCGEPQNNVSINPGGLDKMIFLDLRDINVVDILKFLAVQGDLNIVTSKNVQGRSTLVLRNVKIRDALDIIIISNQLAYEIKNDIIYVMTEEEYAQLYGKTYNDKRTILTRNLKYAKPGYVATALQAVQSAIGKVIVNEDTGTVIMIDSQEKLAEMNALVDQMEGKLETKVVSLQYGNAKEIEAQLKQQVDSKAIGTVYADERSNQLIVSVYPGRIEEVMAVIKALDKTSKAIMLEVRIMQLKINPKYDFGINWEKAFARSEHATLRSLDFKGAFPIDSNVSTDAAFGSAGKIGIGNLSVDDFQVALKALKQVLSTKVLANPRLTVMNREEAKINIGDRIPYVITTTTGTGNNTSVSEEIKFIDVGLSLLVTPIINDDGFITMKIRPEISSQTGTLETPTKNKIPLVNTTFVESTVIVKDGVSVILGGLRRDDYSETTKGLPYLMDIPLFGQAFKSRSESSTKTEIVIFMTPKIITGAKNMTDDPISIKLDSLPALPRKISEAAAEKNNNDASLRPAKSESPSAASERTAT